METVVRTESHQCSRGPFAISFVTVAGAFGLLSASAFGQAEEREPSAMIELGGAGEWGLDGASKFGPNIGVEVTPIEDWLELEADVTPLFSKGQTEWDADFLFKKPCTLSDTTEFMFGVGPSWSHISSGGQTADSFGAQAALDFMYWPWRDR